MWRGTGFVELGPPLFASVGEPFRSSLWFWVLCVCGIWRRTPTKKATTIEGRTSTVLPVGSEPCTMYNKMDLHVKKKL